MQKIRFTEHQIIKVLKQLETGLRGDLPVIEKLSEFVERYPHYGFPKCLNCFGERALPTTLTFRCSQH